jgi:hypothetical protein
MELASHRNKIHNGSKKILMLYAKKNYNISAYNFLSIVNENAVKIILF